jgi:putative acetyltransferase
MSLLVAPLKPEDIKAVRDLLIFGLSERWGRYESRFNPDIEDFPTSYSGAFILVAKSEGVVVGTGTLRQINTQQSEVVRMSTAPNSRRSGIASAILNLLLANARDNGAHEVVLETTSSWSSAISLYTKHGFVKACEQDGNTHFIRHLR